MSRKPGAIQRHQTTVGALTYSIDSGCMGTLTVTVGSVQYVYKLSDIVGRVEVSL